MRGPIVWNCPACGERLGDQFKSCWNCAGGGIVPADAAPAETAKTVSIYGHRIPWMILTAMALVALVLVDSMMAVRGNFSRLDAMDKAWLGFLFLAALGISTRSVGILRTVAVLLVVGSIWKFVLLFGVTVPGENVEPWEVIRGIVHPLLLSASATILRVHGVGIQKDGSVAPVEKLESPRTPRARLGPDAVVVGVFDNPASASILLSRLDAAGVDAAILDAETIGMNPLWSPAIGGVKVAVRKADEGAALAIVREGIEAAGEEGERPEDPESTGTGDMGRACPHCRSRNTFKEKVSGRVAALSILLLGFPLLVLRRGWKCAKCFKRFA